MAGPIDLTALAAALTKLRSSLSTTPNLDGASASDVTALISSLTAAQNAVEAAQTSAETTLSGVSGVTGVIAGSDPATLVSDFVTNAWIACQDSDLTDLSNYLDRIAFNINTAVSG